MKERLILSAQEADTDAMMLKDTSKANPNQLQLFATAEYPAQSKEMTLNDKLRICEASTPPQKLSETSEVVSTSKEKGLEPYWNGLCKVISSKLLLPHRDRIARFGIDLIRYLIEQNGGELVVLDQTEHSPQEELTADLLAILHVFSCRMPGLRSYRDKIKEDKSLSDNRTT